MSMNTRVKTSAYVKRLHVALKAAQADYEAKKKALRGDVAKYRDELKTFITKTVVPRIAEIGVEPDGTSRYGDPSLLPDVQMLFRDAPSKPKKPTDHRIRKIRARIRFCAMAQPGFINVDERETTELLGSLDEDE